MSADESVPDWLSLDPDESVVWVGRPAFQRLYGTILSGLILTVFVVGIFILLSVPLAYLRIQHTDYVVSTKSLYVKKGIFSTNIETVDLDRIQNTEYNQSFWGRQFGYGDISISTAGSSGAEITFSSIPDAKTVRDTITEQQNRVAGRGDDGTGGRREQPADGRAGAEQIDELIAEIRATREAFERLERRLTDSTMGASDPPAEGSETDSTASDDDVEAWLFDEDTDQSKE